MNSKLILSFVAVIVIASQSVFAQQQWVSVKNHEGHHATGRVSRLSPEWELLSPDGKSVDHRKLRGQPHVMIFYLGEGCLHCAKQLQLFRESSRKFRERGFELVAVSSDEVTHLSASIDASKVAWPIRFLADPKLDSFKAFRAYDAFNETPRHGTFLIDAAGQVRWQSIGDHPFTDTEFLVSEIDSLMQDQEQEVERPKVFLDRSPRIVAYQLGRLSNEKLLLVERSTEDKKFAPVYAAILARDGMSPQYREEAVAALAILNDSDSVTELFQALEATKVDSLQGQQTAEEIAAMILEQPPEQLAGFAAQFVESTDQGNDIQRVVSFAALMMAGAGKQAESEAEKSASKTIEWLKSVTLIPSDELRSSLKTKIVSLLGSEAVDVKVAAIHALRSVPDDRSDTFERVAGLIAQDSLRPAAVETLLAIPVAERASDTSAKLARFLVQFAEETPAEDRTSDDFLDAMQLVDQLLVSVPLEEAKRLRGRLNQVTVRVIRIGTVEDEMRYDLPYFAVEAGSSVQVVLDNHDLMAHNLVFTKNGAMQRVAELGGNAGPAKDYLPDNRQDVLFASEMIQTGEIAKLTFEAPEEVGEYPYVCTYPQHWSRMYGVMVVVKDLDSWLKNPVKPKDPIGNTRTFVKNWTVDELKEKIEVGVRGRTFDIGKRMFQEATCAQCHQIGNEGGKVGPALDEIMTKYKNDRPALLREILEPSHRIDEQYVMHRILTLDGATITGIIQSEDDEKYELLDNPESEELTVVLKDDIDQMVRSSKSIMPKALLDNFTEDEIFELFSFLEQSQKK